MLLQEMQQCLFGVVSLDQDFPRFVSPAGATGHLQDKLADTLGTAKVGAIKSLVCLEDAHQSDIWEMVPLGQHLCTNQDIRFTGMDFI